MAEPDPVDTERPSVARMYDYYLGGSQNFAVDREAAREIIAAVPDTPLMAQANRAFLRRVVRYLLDAGIRQFLDIGSGIPTAGNVHEIAQAQAPDARVVYVDTDPIAVAHGRSLLAGNDRARAVRGDLREPESILGHPEVHGLLDFDAPVAVLIIAVLHYILDADDPAGIIARFRDAMAPGSYLALSQASSEGRPAAERIASERVYQRIDSPLRPRDRAELTRLFAGFRLVPPGVVWATRWRPDEPPAEEEPGRVGFVVGLGRLEGQAT